MASNTDVACRFASKNKRDLKGSNMRVISQDGQYGPDNETMSVRHLYSYDTLLGVRVTTGVVKSLTGLPVLAQTFIDESVVDDWGVSTARHASLCRSALRSSLTDYTRVGYASVRDMHIHDLHALHADTAQENPVEALSVQWYTRTGVDSLWSVFRVTVRPHNIPTWQAARHGMLVSYTQDGRGVTLSKVFCERFRDAETAQATYERIKALDPLVVYNKIRGAHHAPYATFIRPHTGYREIVQDNITFISPSLYLYDCGDGALPRLPPAAYLELNSLGDLHVAASRVSPCGTCFKGYARCVGVVIDARDSAVEGRWWYPYTPSLWERTCVSDSQIPAGVIHVASSPYEDEYSNQNTLQQAANAQQQVWHRRHSKGYSMHVRGLTNFPTTIQQHQGIS